ncbi:DUF6252 family protein [Fibrella aquatilis]|uniref:Uncharacterized protein n=1 Tax=Fibrella aquatilis TaxID=2817059 RepID=A0A939K396_9BACT|nr:DUF6252 family protein [Fibrella aquatilis]MBO0934120.1 hypothetical protein [Fibrella aquatilis]
MNQLTNLLLIATVLLFSTCQKEDPLPQSTQTGQNTLGCLIDGKAYIPDGGKPFSGIKPVNGGFLQMYNPLRLGINVRCYSQDKKRLSLYLNNYKLGNHALNQNPGSVPAALYAALNPKDYGLYESSEGDVYATSSKYTGWISLTKADTITGVVAGTFEFQAATLDGKTVSVTNGRFDVNVRTQ